MGDPCQILDWTGGPARARYPRRFIGLYGTPMDMPGQSRPRPLLRPHTFQNISSWQRWELINYARVIRAGIPTIDTALEMKANFAFGNACHIKSRSSTRKWASLIEGHINEEFYPDCNILGPEHDFWTTLTELSTALDCDGGYALVFDTETGKVQVIPATRIGNGWGLQDNASGTVSPLGKGWNDYGMWGLAWGGWASYGGLMFGYMIINDPQSPFNQARIIDGIIVDRNMVRIGVRILGFDESGKMKYKDMPAAQIHLNFKSKWSDQIGFIPQLAPAIMAITNVQDFDFYIKQAMILASAFAVTRKSKDGNPMRAGRAILADEHTDQNGKTHNRIHAFEEIGPGITELSTDNEEQIEAVPFERPSLNEEQFVERVERGYLSKHWPYDLLYGKNIGRAYTRAIGQQVKAIIWDIQRAGFRSIKWMVDRRIEWAMRKGRVPSNNAASDPYQWMVKWPAEFTTDEGNDRDADRQDLKMSLKTRTEIAGKSGDNIEEIDEMRVEEESRLAANAQRLAQQFPFLTEQQWLDRLDQRSANPIQQPAAQPEKEEKPDEETSNAS